MRIHILGICGTFMGGIAALARAAGHQVSGSDDNVYPPMSTQLESLGIPLLAGYAVEHLKPAPDLVLVGNALSRGNPELETVLVRGLPYTSGPQWLAENVLRGQHVLAVAGTHGKTTTSSMLAWILEQAGLKPGYLIGGLPRDFKSSARGGGGQYFVVEADEYDTAFFDKRAKFMHYRARTVVLNNLEYDHADIYPDLASIQTQFQYLLRTVPRNGLLVANAADVALQNVFAQGCWTPRETFSLAEGDWTARHVAADGSAFTVAWRGKPAALVQWRLVGKHNVLNALAAIAAAHHVGVIPSQAAEALIRFQGVKRRLEVRARVDGVTVYDDFAHHPTAIAATLTGLRQHVGKQRIIALLEPRSASMKLGIHRDSLAASLADADRVFVYQAPNVTWDVAGALQPLGTRASVSGEFSQLVDTVATEVRSGDHVLIMSNGGFDGIHEKLIARLQQKAAAATWPL
ncbi:MAG TPA: UDP-N-acetylmuramate:L-alanyl-gamma-D-glutamyl-meso-diaminopimelate ligase [Gammaproteobacteria bacterium]|nr:UDP-N-acetylmuramate:L-alanyl-gamma-D-glutamyl-meso-diaminopimelate ligase [Gammaproteobacteria bacterium]